MTTIAAIDPAFQTRFARRPAYVEIAELLCVMTEQVLTVVVDAESEQGYVAVWADSLEPDAVVWASRFDRLPGRVLVEHQRRVPVADTANAWAEQFTALYPGL